MRLALADSPEASRLAPVILVEGILLWLASSLVDCMCTVPPALRLGMLGLLGAVWIVDYLSERRAPRVAFALAACLPIGFLIWINGAGIAPISLLLLVGWVAYTENKVTSLLVLGMALLTLLPFAVDPAKWLGWTFGVTCAWLIVRVLLPRQRQGPLSADLYQEVAAAERRRIARDVHDVIAHSMTVTMLHLTGARHALSTDPQAAAAALAEAERLGRAGLADIRRTIDVLSTDAEIEALPDAYDIDRLVGEYQRAGLAVDLFSSGDATRLSSAVRLGIYRIVEEALANTARYAPRARVNVLVEIDTATGVHLRVVDSGSEHGAVTSERLGSGLGVAGMRARAALLHGTLSAGPLESGWCVDCVLPPGAAVQAPASAAAPRRT